MSGDVIGEYLARLRASLRTPPDLTAQILAEAEDHLRESAAAGEALGLTEREAQEAAIAAFGQVRAVVRAHRRPSAVASELCLAACKVAAVYLLVVAATGAVMTILVNLLARQLHMAHVVSIDGMPRGFAAARHGSVTVFVPVTVVGCAIAGVLALAGYWWLRRLQRRRRPAHSALLGGYFPLFAAICMLIFGPIVVILTATITPPHTPASFAIPAIAAVVGSIVMALAFTVQMIRTIVRQGRDTGTTGREADYA